MKNAITFLFCLFCGLPSVFAVEHTVTVSNNVFSPANLTIATGDVVKWVWAAGHHSVTSNTGAWPEAILNSAGDQFSHTFNSPGSFAYHCVFHGAPGSGMAGTVVVSGVNAAPGLVSAPTFLKVYPNPATDRIEVSADLKTGTELQILDQTGRTVKSVWLAPGLQNKTFVSVEELPAGIYLLILRQEAALIGKSTLLKAK